MKEGRLQAALCLLLVAGSSASAVVIDRIAVSVGNQVITTSDLDREIRVTAFLNGVKPDFSPAGKHATAERMVEQKLIRKELETSRYPIPSPAEIEPILEKFKKEHFPDDAAYLQALRDYGIAGQDVKDMLLWQRTLLLFVEVRFRPSVQVSDQEIQDYFTKVVQPAAEAAHPDQPVALEDYRNQIESTLAGQREDEQMDNWLRQARRRTETVYHEEAFQ